MLELKIKDKGIQEKNKFRDYNFKIIYMYIVEKFDLLLNSKMRI
jgi:hypothetical protein